mgnify:FL=1
MLFKHLLIVVFDFNICCVVILFYGICGQIQGDHCAIFESFPVKILEPGVFLHLLEGAYPFLGIFQDALIDEICGLRRVILIWLLYDCFDLLRHHLVSNLVFVLATVRPLADHALVSNDAKCKVVGCVAMVSVEHNLWSHVTRGTGLKLMVVVVFAYYFVCNSKIR